MGKPTSEIKKSIDGEYYFRLNAGKREVILNGETYPTEQNCNKGIASVKNNAAYTSKYKRIISSSGEYYFTLQASNGEPIGKSQMYGAVQARENGIGSIIVNGNCLKGRLHK